MPLNTNTLNPRYLSEKPYWIAYNHDPWRDPSQPKTSLMKINSHPLSRILCGLIHFIFFYMVALNLTHAARPLKSVFIDNSRLRTERISQGCILISRLSPADERIRNIILSNNIHTLDDYAQWLKNNLRYRKDGNIDIWSAPEKTLRRKYGDCEDLAFLNKRFLTILSYQPQVIVLLRPLRNHAICVFKESGAYYLVDNTRLIITNAHSEEELTRFLYTRYRCTSFKEISLSSKNHTPETSQMSY